MKKLFVVVGGWVELDYSVSSGSFRDLRSEISDHGLLRLKERGEPGTEKVIRGGGGRCIWIIASAN